MKFWCVQENVRKFLKPAPWLWAASERWAQLRTKPAEKALSWSGQVVTIKSVCVCVWQRVSPSPQHWWCNAQVHSTQPEGLPRPAVLWLVWCVCGAQLGSRRLRILRRSPLQLSPLLLHSRWFLSARLSWLFIRRCFTLKCGPSRGEGSFKTVGFISLSGVKTESAFSFLHIHSPESSSLPFFLWIQAQKLAIGSSPRSVFKCSFLAQVSGGETVPVGFGCR